MKHAGRDEFDDLEESFGDWIQSVSLTKEESQAIRTGIVKQEPKWEEILLAKHISRINRNIAFSNRFTMPYSERHRMYLVTSL